MNFSPIADMAFDRLTDIKPWMLSERGINLLILDIDNTVSPYKNLEPSDEIMEWINRMREGGIKLFIVSNNRGDRPSIFSVKLGVPYIKAAGKPARKGVLEAMELCGKNAEETALVGDQSYTDVLCANRCGITSILVHPIKFTNPLLAIRYFLELPFRKSAKEDFRKDK